MRTKLCSIFYPKSKAGDTRGFTLVELIVAMTLLSIVCVMLFTICTGAIQLISRNGRKSESLSGVKTGLNNLLSGQTDVPSTTESASVSVRFGNAAPVVVEGERVKVESTDSPDGSIKSDMYAFIPD